MMYKNMQILENKHSTILNLYPESLAIVNLVNKQFIYFNKSFDSLFHASQDKSKKDNGIFGENLND